MIAKPKTYHPQEQSRACTVKKHSIKRLNFVLEHTHLQLLTPTFSPGDRNSKKQKDKQLNVNVNKQI